LTFRTQIGVYFVANCAVSNTGACALPEVAGIIGGDEIENE